MRKLINQLKHYTKLYDEGHPEISDKEYDELYFKLQKMEEESGVRYPDSPTQSISYEVVNSLEKIEHEHKMLSLEKSKDIEDVKKFLSNKPYVLMFKMDGLTCSLTYENGALVRAETRGNGIVGENILHNAKVVNTIPKTIPHKERLVVDGEIVCLAEDFADYANEYKNSRNFAAGSIRLLDSKECAKRDLTFVAWDVVEGLNKYNTVHNKLNILESFGFTVVPKMLSPSIADLPIIVSNLNAEAVKYGYPIDGLVFKFDDIAYGQSLGETSHHKKNAFAFKFYDEQAETQLIDIEWGMGRTGQLTPIAIFQSIDLDGSEISRASLHNVSVLKETMHGLPFKGQKVWVSKRNMIIPQIEEAERAIGEISIEVIPIPEICPVCGSALSIIQDNEAEVLYCTNDVCDGKLLNRLNHLCSKKGLDIKGLSEATIEKLMDLNWLNSFSDLFLLSTHRSEWIKLPGFGVKSVDKVLNAIEASRTTELHQFICALGIPLIGTTASKKLADTFETWDNFINAVQTRYKFYSLPDFGEEMDAAIIKFDYTEAKELVENFITFKEATKAANYTSVLNGKTFVATGKNNHFKNRDELKQYIESFGGKMVSSVSKNTSYLINNDSESSSSKNKTAKSLGVPILTEIELIKMCEQDS